MLCRWKMASPYIFLDLKCLWLYCVIFVQALSLKDGISFPCSVSSTNLTLDPWQGFKYSSKEDVIKDLAMKWLQVIDTDITPPIAEKEFAEIQEILKCIKPQLNVVGI